MKKEKMKQICNYFMKGLLLCALVFGFWFMADAGVNADEVGIPKNFTPGTIEMVPFTKGENSNPYINITNNSDKPIKVTFEHNIEQTDHNYKLSIYVGNHECVSRQNPVAKDANVLYLYPYQRIEKACEVIFSSSASSSTSVTFYIKAAYLSKEVKKKEQAIGLNKNTADLKHTILLGSPTRLRQIMLNLFSNAIKYNKVGGKIDTYAKEISFDGITVWYEFKIKDSGIGMSEKFVKEELFDIFTQEQTDARTHYKGSGLGMSIVKQLIKAMHGTIEVKSTFGEGTTFVFQLPFKISEQSGTKIEEKYSFNAEKAAGKMYTDTQERESSVSSNGEESAQNNLNGINILLVEDNDLNMEIAEFYLSDRGAMIEKAWNGQEALDKFTSSAPNTYDIILMDIMMPVMDGLETCRKIRTSNHPEGKNIPIIAMTAQVSQECMDKCQLAGMNGHLTKPVTSEKLIKTIMEFTI